MSKKPTDKELLDWLQDNRGLLNRPEGCTGRNCCHVCISPHGTMINRHYYASTYRGAIMEAMKGEANRVKVIV